MVFFCFSVCVLGEDIPLTQDDTGLIQTELGLDQAVDEEILPWNADAKKKQNIEDIFVKKEEVILINRSLKTAIEENQKLLRQRQFLEKQMGQLRGESVLQNKQIDKEAAYIEELMKANKVIKGVAEKYSQKLEQLQQKFISMGRNYESQVKKLREQLAIREKADQATKTAERSKEEFISEVDGSEKGEKLSGITKITEAKESDGEFNLEEILDEIEVLQKEGNELKKDSAKVHYNLGNKLFKKGEYQKAADEYREAVRLSSSDAEAHYNLAFVSGEYLEDHKTALKHYQQYLFFRPDAQDTEFVQEKILVSSLKVRAMVDSILER